MSTSVRFRDHDQFQRTALYMASGGAIAGVAAAALPASTPSAVPVALAGAAAVLGAAFAEPQRRLGALILRGFWLALGGGALIGLSAAGRPAAALGLFAALAAMALAWGTSGRRLLLAVAVGTGALTLARLAQIQVLGSAELAALPAWLIALTASVTFATVSVFALLPKHVEVVVDPVARAYAAIRPKVGGEVGDLVERGHAVWTDATSELDHDDTNRTLLSEAVLRLYETAERWHASDAEGSQTLAASLVERMESLDDRIETSDDEVVIAQYEQARAALAEQLRYIRGIGTHRERVLARMHNYLAAIERLRLAVVNLKSANASRDSVDLAPIVENLEELGQDIDDCTRALADADAAAQG